MKEYLDIALFLIVTGALLVGFWASTEMIKKTRDAGYRNWALNLSGMFHSLRSKELVVFLVAEVIVLAGVAPVFALR
jgi:hypothetical protein